MGLSGSKHVETSWDVLRALETVGGSVVGGGATGGAFVESARVILLPVVEGAAYTTIELGNTMGFEARFIDENGDFWDPRNSSAQIYIRDPEGTVRADWVSMDSKSLGKFQYQLATDTTMPEGVWLVKVRGQMLTDPYNYVQGSIRVMTAVVY